MFATVFNKFDGRYLSICESETDIVQDDSYKAILNELMQAFQEEDDFSADVKRQVLENLRCRTEHYGPDFVLQSVNELVHYIIGEIAFFEAYWLKYPNSMEIYPGQNLNVKEKIWAGQYAALQKYKRIGLSHFKNVAFLSGSVH